MLAGAFAWATPTQAPKETYKDLIAIAQNLSLQKDRLQATQILNRALQKEKSLLARKELLSALGELSEVFFTEKTQQLFELGESLRFESPQSALDRYNEALKIEPGNVSILKAIGKTQLALGTCDKVLDMTQQALDMNAYAEDVQLLRAQALSCLMKTKDSKLLIEKMDLRKSPLKFYFDIVKVQNLVFEDKFGMAEEELKKLIDQDTKFPETYYWMAQIKLKQKADAMEWNQKYVRLCENITPATRRKYSYEPRLCLERQNVEQTIEQSQTSDPT
jgi:predicted Zn-dependent protease